MKKKTPAKLTLSRETLHHLNPEQIQSAEGGLGYQPKIPATSDSKVVCCA